MTPIDQTSFGLICLFVVLIGLGIRAMALLRIQKKFPALWNRLGQPSLIDIGMFDAPSRRVSWYLLTGQWIRSGDVLLILLGTLIVSAFIVLLVLFYFQYQQGY
jgi:hypothetical protein